MASSHAVGSDWQLEGHGILARNLDRAKTVGEVELFSQPGPSFQHLSRLLNSPTPAGEPGKTVPDAMSTTWHVADAWPYLVETQYSAQLNSDNSLVPPLILLPPAVVPPGSRDFPSGA